jgi:uncharacterized protein YjbJ (UPF0337 family)
MSNASKRAEGAAEELGGKIKGAVGKVIGNEQMEAEGKAKELSGEAKQEAAKAAERTKGKAQEVAGAVKNRVGAVLDNEEMEVEGRAKELEGEARQKANRGPNGGECRRRLQTTARLEGHAVVAFPSLQPRRAQVRQRMS